MTPSSTTRTGRRGLIFRGTHLAAILCLFVLACGTRAFGAEPAKIRFDVPAGDARGTLKQFSAQAGGHLLYSAEAVAGVKTNAVQGEFTPREALNRMVAGTDLAVSQDRQSGALALTRISDPNAGRAAQATASVLRPNGNDNGASAAPADETITLSPFEVQAERATGYLATRTMSGTRLNSRLEDIAASISVVTRQQLEDTAATNINDIFLYEANTEGIYQFTDFTLDASGNQIDNTGHSPNTANRMRGLGAAQISVGGFEVNSIPIDTYNVDAVEINRGPNSSIFGVGDGAGTVNLIAGQANLYNTKGRVSMQVDSYEGFRAEADFNVALFKKTLGLRASAVHDEEGFERKPSYDKTDRYSLSLVARPFKKTTIRAAYENYRNRNKLPNSMTPYDYVTPWIDAGRPTWNPLTQTLTRADGTVLASGVTQANVGRDLFLPGFGVNADGGFMTRITQFIDRGELALYMPAIKRNSASSAPASTGGTTNIFYISTGLVYDGTHATLWKPYGVTDRSMYDWENINIAGANYSEQTAHKVQFDLEQFFIDTPTHRLAAQASFFKEGSNTVSNAFIGRSNGVPSSLMIDVNEYLLDGRPNPFFLRPFMAGTIPETRWIPDTSKTYRAQLAYQLDLSNRESKWLRWLGRQNFLGYGETRERISGSLGYQDFITSAHDWLPATNADGTPRTKVTDAYRQNYRYYIGDAGQYSVGYAPLALPTAAGTKSLYWYKGTTDEWITEDVFFEPLHRANRMKRDNRYTRGVVWQANLFGDKIVPTLGFREDRTRSYDGPSRIANDGVTGYPNVDVMWEFEDPSREYLKTYRTGRTKQSGVVVKPFTWLHLHYNQSDSFVPASVAYNALMEQVPNPQSESKDYGITLYLLRDRSLSLRYNQYETVQQYSRNSTGSTNTSRILRMDFNIQRGDSDSLPGTRDSFNLEGAAWYWVLSDERITPAQADELESSAQAGNTAAAAEMDRLRRKVWEYVGLDFDQYWAALMGAANTIAWTDTSLYTARGRELEISWNPDRYFTLKGSVVNRKAFDSNTSIANSAYVSSRWDYWNSVRIPENFHVYDASTDTWRPAGSSGGTAEWDVHGTAGDLWWNTDYRRQPSSGVSTPNTTPGLWYMQNVNVLHQLAIAQSGQMKNQLSKWAFSATANYRLAGLGTDNFLKNASVGGSVRWSDKQIIGYMAAAPVYDPIQGRDVYMTYDIAQPIYNDPDTQVDLWANYQLGRLFDGKVACKLQLNIRNVFEDGGLRTVKVNPDGTGSNFRIIDPRKFTFTASFEF